MVRPVHIDFLNYKNSDMNNGFKLSKGLFICCVDWSKWK